MAVVSLIRSYLERIGLAVAEHIICPGNEPLIRDKAVGALVIGVWHNCGYGEIESFNAPRARNALYIWIKWTGNPIGAAKRCEGPCKAAIR